MCNARRSVVQGKAAKGFAYLHRFAVYVACLAGPFRAPEVQPRLWGSRRTRRPSTRDLQQCDNFLPLARVPCPRPPRAGPKDLGLPTTHPPFYKHLAPHVALKIFPLPVTLDGSRAFNSPTLFGETLGAFSHRGSLSDKSLHWLMKSEPGHLDVLLDLLSGGRPRCCTSSEVAEPNKILLNL